uniref:Uncharacterized protein n=1 Tax=Rhizophora mucronata TaxID=61149 RepID=A0A2P2P9N5_RHIMU
MKEIESEEFKLLVSKCSRIPCMPSSQSV